MIGRTVIFDTETTGIDILTARIVEIGAIAVEAGKVLDRFRLLCNPGMKISREASRVHSITDDEVADALPVSQAVAQFSEWVEEMNPFTVCAYNLTYNDSLIFNENARSGCDISAYVAVPRYKFCALRLARRVIDPNNIANYQLGTVYEYLTGSEPTGAHGAEYDVQMVDQVLKHLLRRTPQPVCRERFATWINEPQLLKHMVLGKYKGRGFYAIPTASLEWYANNVTDDHATADVLYSIKHELDSRTRSHIEG